MSIRLKQSNGHLLFTEGTRPSGSNGRKAVQVQVLLPAPSSLKPSVYAGLRDFFV